MPITGAHVNSCAAQRSHGTSAAIPDRHRHRHQNHHHQNQVQLRQGAVYRLAQVYRQQVRQAQFASEFALGLAAESELEFSPGLGLELALESVLGQAPESEREFA